VRLKAGGGGVLWVPLTDINGTIGMLLDLNWLPLSESEDRKKAGEAAGRLLTHSGDC
jgi:hypothetical protein